MWRRAQCGVWWMCREKPEKLRVTNQSQVPVENKDDSILVVKKVNFMAFICHTINVAAQLKKKSDRIKTIVQAAGTFLNIRDIKADQIHALLATNEVGETDNQDEG